MRGENSLTVLTGKSLLGPSPHARGKRTSYERRRPSYPVHPRMRGENASTWPAGGGPLRSIPACAGKTRTRSSGARTLDGPSPHARGKRTGARGKRWRSLVHPRMRGENGAPRLLPSLVFRSIPACAGKTSVRAMVLALAPVHPRMRGENFALRILSVMISGPSPHARGKRRIVRPVDLELRSIPACAGKTGHPFG